MPAPIVVRERADLVFYVVADGHIDIWRVLHDRRDIPKYLQDRT